MKTNFPKMSLLVSVIIFVLFCFAFSFLYKTIINNNKKAEQEMIVWQKEANRRDDVRALNLSLQEIALERVMLETHFAESSDIVSFLDTVEQLAPQVGATASIDSVSATPNNLGLVVSLKAMGSFQSLYKFITLLENSPYELSFLSMDIHKSDKSWEADLSIQLLSFIPQIRK